MPLLSIFIDYKQFTKLNFKFNFTLKKFHQIIFNKIIAYKMRTFSTISHEAVRNHQTNNSPTKVAFKFSQSQRFKDPNPQCPKAFYREISNISQLSKRKTSFGYGKKYDFTKTLTCSPPATKYQLRSTIDQAKLKGKTFGVSRDKSPDRSYLIPQLQKVPGPGKYIEKVDTKSKVSFTMRPKTVDVIKKNFSYLSNPGPGVYQQINLEPKTGRFAVAKYNDTKFAKINPNTARFQTIKSTPGPLDYKEKDNLNGLGKYVVSKNKGDGTRAFSKTARFGKGLWEVLDNPGPGNYKETSLFGTYGDSKYYKTMSSFKSAQN